MESHTGTRLSDDPADAFANTLQEAHGSFLLYASDGLSHKSRDAIVDAETKLLNVSEKRAEKR